MDYKILSAFVLLTTPSVMLPKMSCTQVAIHKKGFDAAFKKFKKKQETSVAKKALQTYTAHTPLTYIDFNEQNTTHPLLHKTEIKSPLSILLKAFSATLDIVNDPYLRLFAVIGLIAYARNKK